MDFLHFLHALNIIKIIFSRVPSRLIRPVKSMETRRCLGAEAMFDDMIKRNKITIIQAPMDHASILRYKFTTKYTGIENIIRGSVLIADLPQLR